MPVKKDDLIAKDDQRTVTLSHVIPFSSRFLHICSVVWRTSCSRMAVCCRPLFPSYTTNSSPHAYEHANCVGSLTVVRRTTTWNERRCHIENDDEAERRYRLVIVIRR
ncbi:hypothetical protein TNCV_2580941 [Trichonephila clavipes]|nr:hypothetical protein TNCV_2580941 [Trichonephila clavipes]